MEKTLKNFTYDNVYLIIKIITSLIFLWSGINKLHDPEAFAVTIGAFGIAPEILIQPVVYLLPVLEIILSFLLFFEVKGSLSSVTFLIILFIILLGYGLHIGLDIDCGCFGPEDPEKRAFSGLKAALYRDIVNLGGLFFMFFHRIKKRKSLNY